MAITLGVGPTKDNGDAFPGVASTITLVGTTAGRGILVSASWQDNGGARTISSCTVSGESAATVVAGSKADNPSGGGVDHLQWAFLANNTAGGTKTITINFSGSAYVTAYAVEIAGHDTTAAADNSMNAGLADAGPITGSLTTNTANAAIFALSTNQVGDPTAGANYTLLTNPRGNNGYFDEDEYWLDAGAAAAKTVNFTTGNAGIFWFLSAVSIKVAGGAAAGNLAWITA